MTISDDSMRTIASNGRDPGRAAIQEMAKEILSCRALAAPKSEGAVTGGWKFVAWVTPETLHDLQNDAPWAAGAIGELSQRKKDEYTEPLYANPLPAAREEVGVTEAMVEVALAEWRDSTSLSPRDVMRSILEAALRQAPAAPSQKAVAWRWRDRGTTLWSHGATRPPADMDGVADDLEAEPLGVLASPQGQESGVTKP